MGRHFSLLMRDGGKVAVCVCLVLAMLYIAPICYFRSQPYSLTRENFRKPIHLMQITLTKHIQTAFEQSFATLLKRFLAAVLGLMATACSTKPLITPHTEPPREKSLLRVGTYNVFTGTHDVPKTVQVIRQMHADVVLLQELSPKGAILLDQGLQKDYRYRHFSEGVAILSRFPLRNPRYQHSEHGINGFLFAEIESPGGRLQVASLHLDPLRLWTTQQKWTLPIQLLYGQAAVHRKEVRQITAALHPDLPTVLAGDFNSASHASLDQLLTSGFTDSFADVTRYPDRTPTLHFKLLGFRSGRRIDYILHDQSFKTVQSRTLPGSPSDHDAVISVLRWNHARPD